MVFDHALAVRYLRWHIKRWLQITMLKLGKLVYQKWWQALEQLQTSKLHWLGSDPTTHRCAGSLFASELQLPLFECELDVSLNLILVVSTTRSFSMGWSPKAHLYPSNTNFVNKTPPFTLSQVAASGTGIMSGSSGMQSQRNVWHINVWSRWQGFTILIHFVVCLFKLNYLCLGISFQWVCTFR